ncbi:MAG: Gfo/Idh/MocA family oxidoreductase, partial [Lentisphaeria bacterium]|nr:Gfo/Idh/MocA family oxidoreductase [Lentisphaeria bacterium]
MEKKVQFGVVGVGSRGLSAFSTMICSRKDAVVAAMCDTNPIRMTTAAEKLNITPNFYSNITEMVKNEQLDAVVITTPDFYHEECAVEALEAGVNVLIDKPLATSVKGCRRIIATAEKTGKTVMIGFNLR